MKICANCGAQLPDDAAFCNNCGSALTDDSINAAPVSNAAPVTPATDTMTPADQQGGQLSGPQPNLQQNYQQPFGQAPYQQPQYQQPYMAYDPNDHTSELYDLHLVNMKRHEDLLKNLLQLYLPLLLLPLLLL